MKDGAFPFDPAIRRLWRFDRTALKKHFSRLGPESRRMRFAGVVGDDFVARHATSLLDGDSIVYGAFPDGILRAVAELSGLHDHDPTTAEAAFSVESDFRDRGIGDALLSRVITAARNRNVTSLYMLCLRENERMKHLAVKHDARLEYHTTDVEARLTPQPPNPFSIAREMADETRGLVQAALHWPTHTD